MTATQLLVVLIPLAYVLGSIPFGLFVGLAKGVDPRKSGSGNIGATNVGRLLGGRYFALVFFLDALKSLVPMLAAAMVLHDQPRTRGIYVLWLLIGSAAVIGHMFSMFLRFKGGKGAATSAGVALGVFPYYTIPALVALAAVYVVFRATRIVSVASMSGAIILPLAYAVIGLIAGWDITGTQLPLLIFAIVIACLVIYRHRENIARLRAGTENRIEKKHA